MKTIWKIYKRDFKRLSKNVVALVVAMGIRILPALYAWFNIAANWDPYGSTDGIEVAVVNMDKAYELEGLKFTIGDQIIENLKSNKQIGWTFVDDKKALEGVKSGKYYAAIVIPENFSEKMSSILSGTIDAPKLDYYVNEKKNAIAPKITDKGASAIQQQVNATFISVATETVANVLNVTAAELDSSGVTLIDRLTQKLQDVSSDLGQYEQTITAFANVADGVSQLTKAAQLTIPDVKNVVANSNNVLNNSAATLETSRNTAGAITSTIGDVMNSSESTFDSVASLTNNALNNLGSDANNAADTIEKATAACDTAINMNNQLIDSLSVLKNQLAALGGDTAAIDAMIQDLQSANAKQELLKSQIQGAADHIRQSTANADSIRASINDTVNTGKTNLQNARNSYQTSVQPSINTLLDNISTTTASVSGLLSATDGSLSNLDEIFANTNGALSSGKDALNHTKNIIGSTREKLNNIISQVEAVSRDEQLNKLIEVLQKDPELTGNFMSSPVQLETTSLYAIENYGSAMSPFYSVLAIWVGAIVLVAIMKVGVDEDDMIKGIRPTQAYLGRYLTFMTFGLVQATVIALGDLFYLNIQCLHPVKFFICAWVCSFVFTNIVYALTVSFGAIGKAVSVIFLVLQIGGSGGTFPIEVTPPFFQILNPFMPFTYGINAMRECVAGTYKYAFWGDLGKLLIYIPFALLLGLILRRPLMNLTHFFEQRLEDSKLL
ncbi:MAG: YhgE/Pip domain-containing protein [Hespellia sp.]|nr:YhgE/Pip domain-containing protein [Hespellia sp.]